MNPQHYPALTQLLGGYFHQDWVHEFSTSDNAIKAYLEREPPETVRQACKEMDQLIPLVETIGNPDEVLAELGCYYNVQSNGLIVAKWLEQVRSKLKGE